MVQMENNFVNTKEEVLKRTLEAREQEVMHYQINIDNYTLALEKINSMPLTEQKELSDFSNQLRSLLITEKLEQKKAQIMLSVLQDQMG